METFALYLLACLLQLPLLWIVTDAIKDVYGLSDWRGILVGLTILIFYSIGGEIVHFLKDLKDG